MLLGISRAHVGALGDSMSHSIGPEHRRGAGSYIRNPRDFYGGLAIVAVALFSFWAGSDLPGMQGIAFGPGTAPRLFGGLLLAFGVLIAALGLATEGPHIGGYAVRGPAFITASLFAFAAMIRPVGLIGASFVTFMIAAAASRETRWAESTVMAVAMTAFCVVLFVYLLKLPFHLRPQF
jgi:putative tricarboxylic transport membrane protein